MTMMAEQQFDEEGGRRSDLTTPLSNRSKSQQLHNSTAISSGNAVTAATGSSVEISNGNNLIQVWNNNTVVNLFKSLPVALQQQAVASLVFHLVGWYLPRFLQAYFTTNVVERKVPYQTISNNDSSVILDFSFNLEMQPYPYVPTWLLMSTCYYAPFVVVTLVCWRLYFNNNRSHFIHILHAAVCGLLITIGLCEGTTHLVKILVQRRRPCFYEMCGFDKATRKCTASAAHILEANLSFPSGHSSLSSCAMTFLVWFFLSRIITAAATTVPGSSSNTNVHWRRLYSGLACIVPWVWTMWVGISRIIDHWHHVSDVLAGWMLGFVIGTLVYHLHFPPTWLGENAYLPYSLRPELGKAEQE